jgi:protein TonB
MLNTLLETKPVRTKRIGGTVMSTMMHAAVVAGAIALTRPLPLVATTSSKEPPPLYIKLPTRPDLPRDSRSGPPVTRTQSPRPDAPNIQFADPKLPVIAGPVVDVRPTTTDDFGDGAKSAIGGVGDGAAGGLGVPVDGVVDEHLVDRAPRIVGRAPEPEFPSALRQSGTNGRVVVQFAVDTLGRAEMGGLKMIEMSDVRFGDAVRAVLPRYRFSPGEVRGRKVRTLVQIPFDFTLVR